MVILNPTTGQLVLVVDLTTSERPPVFEPCALDEDAAEGSTGAGTPNAPEAERPSGSVPTGSDGWEER